MNKLMISILSSVLLGITSAGFCEAPVVRDRQDEIHNEELRRAVAADREAAKLAHEQEMAKQREADTQRLETIEGSKERYKEVLVEREANEKRTPQEKEQVREQRQAEKSQKSEKTKVK